MKSILYSSALFLMLISSNTCISQNFEWAGSLDGGDDDMIKSLTLDNLGNVYILGTYTGNVDFDLGPDT